jgi:hypothetical protein
VIGLVTIKPKHKISFFKKNIYTIMANTVFVRRGSNSIPTEEKIPYSKLNVETLISIENNSRNSIAHTLDGVMDFVNVKHGDMNSQYKVFKELFVICWAGIPKKIRETTFLSRVDIELINERVKLFYSAFDVVTISYDEDHFTIIEHVPLGLNDQTSFYPLEKVTISFFDNGYYKIESKMLFDPPKYNIKMLHHIYNSNISLLSKLQKETVLSEREEKDLEQLPYTLMICYLNGFQEAKHKLIAAKTFYKNIKNPLPYINFKEALRILRKMKYNEP